MTQQQIRDNKYKELTIKPTYPLIVRKAIPSMIGIMISTIYSMTDTYFVGKLNDTDMLAAVGIVFTFISMVQAVGFWFGYGSGNYISRMLGKRDIDKAETMAAKGVVLAIMTGSAAMILGLLFLKPLALLLGGGVSVRTLEEVIRYLRITVITVPIMLVSNVIYNELRLAASAKESMLGLLTGMIINMVLDPVFILILGMGVSGAAFASLLGQLVGAAILWYSTTGNGNVPVKLSKGMPDRFHTLEILKGGAPNFCRQGISSISSIILNNTAAGFGVYAVAAITIAVRIAYIASALVIGFGQGFQPICAINYGAGLYPRVKKSFIQTYITVTVFLFISVPILYIYAEPLVMRFSNDAEVIDYAVILLRAQLSVMPFMGYYILIGMLLQNIGRFGRATLVTVSENGLFLIPVTFIMPRIMGIEGLTLCKPLSSILALIFSIIIGIRAWKQFLAA